METKHTAEPWHVGGMRECTIYDHFGQRVANSFEGVMVFQRSDAECSENARRIVACVNACAGIPTQVLEYEGADMVRIAKAMQQQRDELAAALEEVLNANEAEAKALMSLQNAEDNFTDKKPEQRRYEAAMVHASTCAKQARELLAKVKGQ